MLVIRRAQMDALARSAMEPFVENVIGHLRRVWPEECAAMGEEGLEAFVAHGMAKCDRYEIDTEYDVGRYCDVMLLLHPDFDEDPLLPWAQETLTAPGYDGRVKVDQLMERVEALCQDMLDALDAAEE
ncbi:MAG: hypothetical protein Q8S73_11470 [Deltaproteobacteria bacterium]|nr:hypothetical protein [Myxococcales bacterium]MDP3214717.1 hypothetical protein [Deltaproteobacteria bacterium]